MNEKKLLKKLGFPTNFDKLTEEQRYKYNSVRQKKIGNKKYDYFEITEPGHSKKIMKFKNIKDWDYKEYKFQKKHHTAVRPVYDQLYMPGSWFRVLELNDFGKRELTYGSLESARSFLFQLVFEKLNDLIDLKYPYIHVRPYGTKMFEKTEDKRFSIMTSYETRACGFEKERKELEKKLFELYNEIDDTIVSMLKPYQGYTFRKYSDTPKYDMLDSFIIGGFEAAEDISFKTFLKDFTKRQQPVEYLERIGEQIYRKYKKRLLKK